MNIERCTTANWDWLIGYPLEEAKQILSDDGVPYKLQFTVAPRKLSTTDEAFVIAVRNNNFSSQKSSLVLICATADWSVN